jgi:hypothetical protein
MITLISGEPYPLALPEEMQGARTLFLTTSGSFLQIILPGMSSEEEDSLRAGMIKAGLLYKSGSMLFLFQFYDTNGMPLLTFDAPFDIRQYPAKLRNLINVENSNQHLAFQIHVVDENKILQVIRLVTMPPELTLIFLSAIQEQLAGIDKPGVMEQWLQLESDELIKQAQTWILVDS